MSLHLRGDPSEPRPAPDYRKKDKALKSVALTAFAVAVFLVLFGVLGALYVDDEHYVSDDADAGRAAIAPFMALPGNPKGFRVTRECYELSDEAYSSYGTRAWRHFMYGCSGIWFTPSPEDGD